MKILFLLFNLVAITLVSAPAQANKLQFDYLMLDADLDDVDDFEPDAIQFKFINPVKPGIDLVGVFAIGISDDEVEEFDPFFGNVSLSVDLKNLIGIYGRAHGEVETGIRIFGHLGLVRLNYDLDAEILGLSGSESYDDTGIAFGVGAAFDLSDRASLVIEYNQYPDVDVEDTEIDSTSLSLGFQMAF